MAQEWYLLKSPHDQVSGFESEAFDDFAQEGFSEALESSIACTVELCNYDLSQCKKIKAIVENNVQDTKLKTLNRQILLPVGTCKAGMYVKYKDRYWLIVGLVDDNTMYEKAVLALCNHLLSWVNDEGKVVQRWVNAQSASQYNNGETGAKFYYYTYRSDQLLIAMPDDDESLMLKSGKRFIIDNRCKVYEKKFDNNVECDTSNPVITYSITRLDSVLYDYQNSGHFEFMCFQDEQRDGDGYYVINGKGYWLCEQPKEDSNKSTVLSSLIEYDELEIFNGLDAGIFTAKFFDKNGKETNNVTPIWSVNCDFADKLDIEFVDNSICISANDRSLINLSFELSLSAEGYETKTVKITIRAFI
jgi:hypothetical protein